MKPLIFAKILAVQEPRTKMSAITKQVHRTFYNLCMATTLLGFWPFKIDKNGNRLIAGTWKAKEFFFVIFQSLISFGAALYATTKLQDALNHPVGKTSAGIFIFTTLGGGVSIAVLRMFTVMTRNDVMKFWNHLNSHAESIILAADRDVMECAEHGSETTRRLNIFTRDLRILCFLTTVFGLSVPLGAPFDHLNQLLSDGVWVDFGIKSLIYATVTLEPLVHGIYYVLLYAILRWISICYGLLVDQLTFIIKLGPILHKDLESAGAQIIGHRYESYSLRHLETRTIDILNTMRKMNEIVDEFNFAFRYQLLAGLYILGVPILMTLFVLYSNMTQTGPRLPVVSYLSGCILHCIMFLCLCSVGSSITENVNDFFKLIMT